MRKLSQALLSLSLLAAAGTTAACLVKDTSHSISLEPDGSATWTVLERNVHATADTPADRAREEEEYLAKARAGQGANEAAFRALGASTVATRIAAANWPFAVLTAARFPSVADMLQACFDAAGEVRGQSTLEQKDGRTTWRVVVIEDKDAASARSSDTQEAVANLLAGIADGEPLFLIRHGQFVDAAGFTITDDGRVAKLDDLSKWDWEARPRLEVWLTWTDKEAGSR